MRDSDFERLYEAHAGPLLNFLHFRIGDRALAEDLLADTFERVLRTRRRFNPRRGSEKTWLYTIAVNILHDHLRRAAVGQRAMERVTPGKTELQGADELAAVEERDLVQRALDTLSAEEREAIALRYAADLTVAEIARLTGEKVSTVHGRVYRSVRKLKEQLDR